MAINKVVMNTENGVQTLIDLTTDTVTPETLAKGVTAHDKGGNRITGTMPASSIPKAAKIKYIIPATYTPTRTSDDYGYEATTFTFTRENVNQLFFVDWQLQDVTDTSSPYWTQHIIWSMHYQGNYPSQHTMRCEYMYTGVKGNGILNKVGNYGKTALTSTQTWGACTTTDATYRRMGKVFKGLIFIYDSTYNGEPIVDATKLNQFFTCDTITEGM